MFGLVESVIRLWKKYMYKNEVGELQYISQYNRNYDSIFYVILFPYGEPGHEYDIPFKQESTVTDFFITDIKSHYSNKKIKCLNPLQYYSYRLMRRTNNCNIILRGGKLLQQYLVDMCLKIQTLRLQYFKNYQHK